MDLILVACHYWKSPSVGWIKPRLKRNFGIVACIAIVEIHICLVCSIVFCSVNLQYFKIHILEYTRCIAIKSNSSNLNLVRAYDPIIHRQIDLAFWLNIVPPIVSRPRLRTQAGQSAVCVVENVSEGELVRDLFQDCRVKI